MRVPVSFIDRSGNITDDYVSGYPAVRIKIEVGFKAPDDPNEEIGLNFEEVWALIDTGADHTIVNRKMGQGKQESYTVLARNMVGEGYEKAYGALLQIMGLDKPYNLDVAEAPIRPAVALGREMLSKYKLVMDFKHKEFYLENS